jgi:hypothetical protein
MDHPTQDLMSMIRISFLLAIAASAMVLVPGTVSAQNCPECSPGGHLGAIGGHFAGGSPNVDGFGSRAGWIWHSTWGDYWAYNQSMQQPWHGQYYWLRTGQPTALVVPPTITMQSNYSWGVSQNTMTPVWHQFSGRAPSGGGGGVFRATPYWPSHTDQFGVYPVRGPW